MCCCQGVAPDRSGVVRCRLDVLHGSGVVWLLLRDQVWTGCSSWFRWFRCGLAVPVWLFLVVQVVQVWSGCSSKPCGTMPRPRVALGSAAAADAAGAGAHTS